MCRNSCLWLCYRLPCCLAQTCLSPAAPCFASRLNSIVVIALHDDTKTLADAQQSPPTHAAWSLCFNSIVVIALHDPKTLADAQSPPIRSLSSHDTMIPKHWQTHSRAFPHSVVVVLPFDRCHRMTRYQNTGLATGRRTEPAADQLAWLLSISQHLPLPHKCRCRPAWLLSISQMPLQTSLAVKKHLTNAAADQLGC